jgi:Domain of unknown function (DUF4328)
VLLWAQALSRLAVAGFAGVYLSKLDRLSEAELPTSTELSDANDAFDTLVAVAHVDLLVNVVCAVVFVVWTYRGYRNLAPLGASGLRFANGWAIGGWFVPVMFLWRPKQVVNDMWRASAPELPATTAAHADGHAGAPRRA